MRSSKRAAALKAKSFVESSLEEDDEAVVVRRRRQRSGKRGLVGGMRCIPACARATYWCLRRRDRRVTQLVADSRSLFALSALSEAVGRSFAIAKPSMEILTIDRRCVAGLLRSPAVV